MKTNIYNTIKTNILYTKNEAIADNLQEGYPVELTTADESNIKLSQEGDDAPRPFKVEQEGRTLSFNLYDSMIDYLLNFTFTNIKF